MKTKSVLLTVVILFFVSNISSATTASFQGLGDLPGGSFKSEAYGVSANGSVVVGVSMSASGNEAFRWENGVMVGLSGQPEGYLEGTAKDVSANGSVIVGRYSAGYLFPIFPKAFRWTYGGGMVGLGALPGGFRSQALGVSANGSVVVGDSSIWSSNPYDVENEAFRWENGQMVGLGVLPGGSFNSWAYDVSFDGSVVVGASSSSASGDYGREAFRWENWTMVGLGDLPGGEFYSQAYGVSADGSVVVGYSESTLGYEAFRWENGEMVGLGDLPDGDFQSEAFGVSADGSVVVGYGLVGSGHEAFIWDAENGMRSLKGALENDCGLDLTGWHLTDATNISADGLTIVGYGRNPAGYTEGWIATIPEPGTVLLLGFGALMMRRKRDR